jgi:hypothetical protein
MMWQHFVVGAQDLRLRVLKTKGNLRKIQKRQFSNRKTEKPFSKLNIWLKNFYNLKTSSCLTQILNYMVYLFVSFLYFMKFAKNV